MIKYSVFIKNCFNELSCIGTAFQLSNGCLCLRLDAIPRSSTTEMMLVPTQPKADVVELKPVDRSIE